MCKVIAVSCSKGGVGKTTSAVNIGIGLAYSGKKVLLLDVDGQGDLSKSLGVQRAGEGNDAEGCEDCRRACREPGEGCSKRRQGGP